MGKRETFTGHDESEAIALAGYFRDCGLEASRKGLTVTVTGADQSLVNHLYQKFLAIALL